MSRFEKNPLTVELILESKNEVISQISKTITTIKESARQDNVLKEEHCKEWVNLLEEEKRKVEDLRYTIAVVGNMKAGKSTTINAIVGMEVLPNRSAAMTILPTVITHTPGQKEPVLTFPKIEPFNEAVRDIRERLQQLDKKNGIYEMSYDHLDKMLDRIREGSFCEINDTYQGQNGIYEFMESVNDIVRICRHKDFNLFNPIEEYTALDEFPHIEIEFTYFADHEVDTIGKLSLVDTPGHNEAGQGHLRSVVREQLKNASAILCVLNYIQLNTSGEEELRVWINDVKKSSNTELFVLVNRFDERTKGKDMNRQKTKEYVDKQLFGDYPIEDKIFPVSAKWGYLSNRVIRELDLKGVLPHPEKELWVGEFCEKVFGDDWEEALEDEENLSEYLESVNELREGAKKRWKRSYLAEPFEQVISFSLQNVVPLTLHAGLDEIKSRSNNLQQSLKIKHEGLKQDILAIEESIRRVDSQVKRLKDVKKECNLLRKRTLKEIEGILSENRKEIEKTAGTDIKQLFKKETEEQQKEIRRQRKKEAERRAYNKSTFESIFKSIRSLITGNTSKSSYPDNVKRVITGDEEIEFENQKEAAEFLNKLSTTVWSDVEDAFNDNVKSLNIPINKAQNSLNKQIKDKVNPILDELKEDLRKQYKLDISISEMVFEELKFDLDDLERELVRYEKEQYTVSERREKGGIIARGGRFFGGLFNKDWGYEYVDVTKTREYYALDPKEVRKEIQKSITQMANETKDKMNKYLDRLFNENLEFFFKEIDEVFKNVLDDFKSVREIKEKDKKSQRKIKEFIKEQLERVVDILKRQEIHRRFLNEQFDKTR